MTQVIYEKVDSCVSFHKVSRLGRGHRFGCIKRTRDVLEVALCLAAAGEQEGCIELDGCPQENATISRTDVFVISCGLMHQEPDIHKYTSYF